MTVLDKEATYPVPSLKDDKERFRFYRQAMQLHAAGEPMSVILATTPFTKEEIKHWMATRWSDRATKEIEEVARAKVSLSSDRIVNVVNSTLALLEREIDKLNTVSSENPNVLVVKPQDMKSLVGTAKSLYEMLDVQQDKDEQREKQLNAVKSASITSVKDFARMLQQIDPDVDYSEVIDRPDE